MLLAVSWNKFYFGNSLCLIRGLMALVALQGRVVLSDWIFTVVNHFMTGEAFDLFFSAMRDVQFLRAVLLLISKVMTIQAPDVLYVEVRVHLSVMAHLFAIKLGHDKFGVVNTGYAPTYWLGGCIVTIPALSSNQTSGSAGVFREMADKTNLGAYLEVFLALEMVVARSAKYR